LDKNFDRDAENGSMIALMMTTVSGTVKESDSSNAAYHVKKTDVRGAIAATDLSVHRQAETGIVSLLGI
jgi:hypothetical protein